MNSSKLFFVHTLFSVLPPTRCFELKRRLLRWAGATIGKNVRIASSARFYITGNLSIGDNTWIGHQTIFVGGNADVQIGANVDIGPRVTIATGTHQLFEEPHKAAGRGYSTPVRIEDGCWIGVGATILGGSILGTCSMVGAGALVKQRVGAKEVVGGIPAHPIRVSTTH